MFFYLISVNADLISNFSSLEQPWFVGNIAAVWQRVQCAESLPEVLF